MFRFEVHYIHIADSFWKYPPSKNEAAFKRSPIKNSTWIYSSDTEEFSTGPDLIDERYRFAAVVFHSELHDFRPVCLVTGGLGSNAKSCEILDFTQKHSAWQRSKKIYSKIF